jgi:hypothetical protein
MIASVKKIHARPDAGGWDILSARLPVPVSSARLKVEGGGGGAFRQKHHGSIRYQSNNINQHGRLGAFPPTDDALHAV